MVRIVNGEIVEEGRSPSGAVPYSSPPEYYKPFPSTGEFLGPLSTPVHIFNVEIEVLWLICIFITGYLFGFRSLIIFIVVTFILGRNIKLSQANKSRINTLH